jgi:hypothetical protein
MEPEVSDSRLKYIKRRLLLLGPAAALIPGVAFHLYGSLAFAATLLVPFGVVATSIVVRNGLRYLVWYRWFLGLCLLWALLYHVVLPFIPSGFTFFFTYAWYLLPFVNYQFFDEEPPLHIPRG